MKILLNILFAAAVLLASCGGARQNATAEKKAKAEPVGPVFSADSAFAYCEAQCALFLVPCNRAGSQKSIRRKER